MAAPWLIKSFSPGFNFENTGIPMVLYGPKASFYGWIVLMVLISPFLQLLAVVFSSFLALPQLIKTPFK